ncbi:transposase [Vallitalea longa]|uniref:Transposase n=1 Tax=Vallitalea longa TaxID=2936439 RepID=A0A9W6DDW5_9FIRM|nr:IS200/IS605 family element RNA-guided endonuclease TnpB [Vallitalea longa]GKX29461.1 transposase [Vallitalea longa]
MKINKAFKYRIYPNKEQLILIHKTFGCTRFVFNRFLNQRIELYKNEEKSTTYVTQAKELTALKKDLTWLKEVDSVSLQSALRNLDTAFKNFFQKRAKYPRFKSKRNNIKSYTTKNTNNSIRIEGSMLKFPKLGLLKTKFHREIPRNHKILSATISQVPTGAYFVSITTEFEKEIIQVPSNGNIVGLDFSMKELFVSSENQRAKYPRFFRMLEAKLIKAQRKLSRMVRFSNNWYKQKTKVARIHYKIKNSRSDFLHKLSTQLVNKYNAIAIEDLNMKGMSQVLKFGKSVSDNGWGMFIAMIKYKAELRGKQLVKIDRFYPSSKTCSICGAVKKDLKLSERVYTCECGNSIDRDLNASINIKNQGKLLLQY